MMLLSSHHLVVVDVDVHVVVVVVYVSVTGLSGGVGGTWEQFLPGLKPTESGGSRYDVCYIVCAECFGASFSFFPFVNIKIVKGSNSRKSCTRAPSTLARCISQ